MTTTEAIHKLCRHAYDEVGYHEGYNNYNKYAANPLVTEALGWDAQNQAWCSIFVIAMFIDTFGFYAGTHMMYGCSALCKAQAEYYRQNAAYYNSPQKGDQIFFYYDGDINHTGIVVDISGSTITTVEGNSGDAVAERTYYINDGSIAGYGRPNWAIVADEEPEDPDEPDEPDEEDRAYPVLNYPDGMLSPMETVKAWQQLLVCWGYDLGKWGVDGEFGVITMQRTKEFQKRVGLPETGAVGEDEWKQVIYLAET